MTGDKPSDLPDLRLWLRDMWSPGRPYYNAALDPRVKFSFRPRLEQWKLQDEEAAKPWGEWEYRQLEQADLWWVSADMVDLLMATVSSVPGDVHGLDLFPPSPAGLVVFEKPWFGTAVDSERPVEISACLWGITRLPPTNRRGIVEQIQAYSVSSYTREGLTGVRWAPLGRSDWPIDDALDSAPWPGMTKTEIASFVEDRRVIAALWTLVTQRGIAETSVVQSDRPTVRRTLRAGFPKESSNIRVVKLRKLDRVRSDGESGVNYHHRWFVSGHWRRQPYGPGNKLRRLTFIAPHIKGPEGKPLIAKEQVNAWVR